MKWLTHPDSFITFLKSHGIATVNVQVLSQAWAFPTVEEKRILHIGNRRYALIREVLISSPQHQWMVARTVIPIETLTGKELQLAKLKSRSLGSVLFKDAHLQRSEFEFLPIKSAEEWHHVVSYPMKIDHKESWARRSLFYTNQKTLLLSEIFLSALKAI